MAKKEHISETQATQFLRKHGVGFSEHPYAYEEHGGTKVSAREKRSASRDPSASDTPAG